MVNSLTKDSIATWEEIANKFLTKYFPPSKLVKLQGNITSFAQFDNESIYEAWERYKDLIRKCPHYGLPAWLEIEFFYNRLQLNTMVLVDTVVGGAFMGKERDEAYELLEEMTSNDFQWQDERTIPKKVAGMCGLGDIMTLHA